MFRITLFILVKPRRFLKVSTEEFENIRREKSNVNITIDLVFQSVGFCNKTLLYEVYFCLFR